MAASKVTSKPTTYVTSKGISIDGYAGPWSSTGEFETYWSATLGHSEEIANGIVIRVVDASGITTIYKRSAGKWVIVGTTDTDAGSIGYDAAATYLDGTVGKKLQEVEDNLGEGKFPAGTVTAYDAHGLERGTDISNWTVYEVLDAILNAEFAPKWTNANAKISIGKTLYYVGDSVPAQTAFTTSGSPASAQGKVTTTGGAVESESYSLNVAEGSDVTEDDDDIDFGSKVISRGTIEVEYSRKYAASTEQVVSSKGTPTNRTSSNSTTKLKDAQPNTSIDADSNTIVEMDVYSDGDSNETAKLYFAYPIYIDGSVVSNLSYSGSSYSKTKDVGVDGAISFEVPSRYTNIKVWYQNSMTKEWIEITTCTTTSETKKIGANQVAVDYTKLTHSSTDGSTMYKVTFTIA